ncbi:MAG: tRNA pseudouridine(38-40) synthase TruA [Ignavibacteriales bacterium]
MEKSNRNIKLIIEYDGTDYHGWQRQPNRISIQEVLENTLSQVLEHEVSIISAGRTDAGVHALGQCANFKTDCRIPAEKIPYALNALLPDDIVIKHACEVSADFHARFSVKGKYYKYIINNGRFPSAIDAKREYFCPYRLNIDLMKEALEQLLGTHDFKGFMASGCAVKNTVKTIYEAGLEVKDDKITIGLKADGFLYNMVRIIAGTLIDVGRGRIPIENVKKALETGERSLAGKTVQPQGLYLVEVYYI